MTEFQILRREIKKDRERLIVRLQNNLTQHGDCLLWMGRRGGGARGRTYGFINFKINGQNRPFLIHRVFLTLRLRRPISRFMEAGHYQCHNPLCVVHVAEQTRRDNMKDANGRREEKRAADRIPF